MLTKRLERAKSKIILPLDVDSLDKAFDLIDKLHPYVGMFKIGFELITAGLAPKIISYIKEKGSYVFYDGKFNDIPNTVGNAAKAASKLGAKIFNIHASAGKEAMKAAVENKGEAEVFVVTVLTSISNDDSQIIFGNSSEGKVLQFALHASLANCDGIICSPQEISSLRALSQLSGLKIMTPGIRPEFSQVNDQKRVMTPAEAIKAGADYLVIGRPITQPDGMTQEEAALKVLEEVSSVLDEESNGRQLEIEKIFSDTNAIIDKSHVVYTSGKHGQAYVNKDAIYPHVNQISKLCLFMAENFKDYDVDAIVGPVVGGVALAQWTAFHLSLLQGKEILALTADKDGDGFVIKRGQEQFIKGKKILVVEDVLTTGGSVKKVVDVVNNMDGYVVGVSALCNRGGITVEDIGNVPVLMALMNITLDAFDEKDCIYCKKNLPINTSVGKGAEYLKNRVNNL